MLDLTRVRASANHKFSIVALSVVASGMLGCATTSVPYCSSGACSTGYATGTCETTGCGQVAGATMQGPGQGGYILNDQSVSGYSGTGCGPSACGTSVCNSGACGIQGCAVEGCGTEGCVTGSGCGGCDIPRELRKASLPDYRIEPPDVLLIEAANNLRPADDAIASGEPLIVQVNRTVPYGDDEDLISRQFKTINGPYVIGTDGYLNLGPEYGKVHCAGQSLSEIQRRVEVHLKRILTNPQVLVTLPDPSAKQAVAGPHLVRPDGTVGLGIYGGVYVAGMTLAEAKCAIEEHLSKHMHNPQISVDVLGYNSKVYYVIADGGGAGEQVHRLPSTGNETVLDAIAQIRGLPTVANKGKIWIARPSPDPCRADQVLHVDWDAIARGAQTCTNYQIFPGDRLYVQADCLIRFDTNLAKFTAPFERLLGLAVLGNSLGNNNNNNN